MEFDFVDDRGVLRDTISSLDEGVGEVETVFAASVHALHAEDEALEHRCVEVVDNGVAVSVGLFYDVAREHVGAFEVKGNSLSDFGVRAMALLEDFVVIAFGGFGDVLVGCDELGEAFFLQLVGILGTCLSLLLGVLLCEECYVLACCLVGLLVERLLLAAEGAFEGLLDKVLVKVEVLGGLGEAHAHGPAKGVVFVLEDDFFGVVVAGCCCKDKQRGCEGGCEELFHYVEFLVCLFYWGAEYGSRGF